MEAEGPFPTQGMVVELGSIRMTWTAAEDGQLNLALPSWEWEASAKGIKSAVFWVIDSFGEAKPMVKGIKQGLGIGQ